MNNEVIEFLLIKKDELDKQALNSYDADLVNIVTFLDELIDEVKTKFDL